MDKQLKAKRSGVFVKMQPETRATLIRLSGRAKILIGERAQQLEKPEQEAARIKKLKELASYSRIVENALQAYFKTEECKQLLKA